MNTTSSRRWRKWAWGAAAALILLPLAALYVLAATDPDENIVLSRNQVIHQPSGTRLWRGTYWNHSDSLYTGLDVVLLFLDKDGKPVGQAQGEASRQRPLNLIHPDLAGAADPFRASPRSRGRPCPDPPPG